MQAVGLAFAAIVVVVMMIFGGVGAILGGSSSTMPLADDAMLKMYKASVHEVNELIAHETSEGHTPIDVPIQKVITFEAILLDQEWERGSQPRATNLALQFVERHEEKEPCPPPPPATSTANGTGGGTGGSGTGNPGTGGGSNGTGNGGGPGSQAPGQGEQPCEITIVYYTLRSDEEVMQLAGITTDEQKQRVADMLKSLEEMVKEEAEPHCAPEGWHPNPQAAWFWPTPNEDRLTSCFGERIDPVDLIPSTHYGLDIGVGSGTPVYAARDGIVEAVNLDPKDGCGLWVKIVHDNGLATRYCHLDKVLLTQSAQVHGGSTMVGLSGNTGEHTTGAHLHLEVYLNRQPTDPLAYFR